MAKIYDDQKGPKDEWAKLKNAPLKEKLEYLAEYYGKLALVIVAVLALIIATIPTIIKNKRPVVISGEYVVSGPEEENIEALHELLCETFGLDPEEVQTSIAVRMLDMTDSEEQIAFSDIIAARVMAKDLDFVSGSEDVLKSFNDPTDYESCVFASLAEFLPEDLIAELDAQGRLISYTMDDGTTFPYLIDPTDSRLSEILQTKKSAGYIGLVVNSERGDAIVELCRLIAE